MDDQTTTNKPEAESAPSLPPPDAVIELRFDTATNNMALNFQYGSDLSHPANHFAAWLQRNTDAVSAMAAREFNAVREAVAFVRLPVFEQPPEVPPHEKKPTVVESVTPRLVSPHGGPLN